MTADEFRKLALDLPEAVEAAHVGHPDFRIRGKIFATLFWQEEDFGMVKLTREEQQTFILSAPEIFQPIKGAWGARGCTRVCLQTATPDVVRRALIAAWRNTAPKRLAQQFDEE